jgi:WD40 repeat protein
MVIRGGSRFVLPLLVSYVNSLHQHWKKLHWGVIATVCIAGCLGCADVEPHISYRTLSGHTDSVESIAYSPDGEVLATGSADQTVRLWDVKKGSTKRIIHEYSTSVLAVAYSHDGKLLAAASDGDETTELRRGKAGDSFRQGGMNSTKPKLWISDVITGEITQRIRAKSRFKTVAFADNDKLLVAGGTWGVVQCLNTQGFNELYSIGIRKTTVYSVTIFPGSKKVAIGTGDGFIEIWDIPPTREPSMTIRDKETIRYLAVSPDGKVLASASQDGKIQIWDATTGKLRAAFSSDQCATCVAFSPDGKILATCGISYRSDETKVGKATLWDVRSKKTIIDLNGHRNGVTALAFAPDGKSLATGDGEGDVRIWVLPADLLEK